MTLSRRDFLAAGAASVLAGPAFAAEGPSLRELAQAKGILFGSAVPAGPRGATTGPFEDAKHREILARECGVLVPENELKWYVVRARGPQYFDFERADRIAEFAKANGQALRGHTLIWHHPRWFPGWVKGYDFGPKPAEAAAKMVTEHIQALCRRYPQMVSWDVINETVDPADGSIRSTFLSDAMGKEEVLDLSFHVAREAAPKARLVYNDYMSQEVGNEKHRYGVLKLLEGFRKRGTPVDALGVQARPLAHAPARLHARDGAGVLVRVRALRAEAVRRELREVGDGLRRRVAEELDAQRLRRRARDGHVQRDDRRDPGLLVGEARRGARGGAEGGAREEAARVAQPATLARLARHEPRREDASHDGFQLAPEPADAERRAQITTRVEDGPALLLGDAPAARERRAT